jgi:uncharacterized protein YbbK (DUF523 family)
MKRKFRIGISSCLLGNEVRWNAGHKHDKYLTRTLGRFVDYVPVCPEVEAGFGVPRESFRLVGDPDAPRLVTFNPKRITRIAWSPGPRNASRSWKKKIYADLFSKAIPPAAE